MAGNVLADLVVRVTGDITPVVTAFGKLKSEMTALQTIGRGFTAVGAAMTAGITLPIMAVGVAAVKSAVTVGGAYKDIQGQTGATGAELEKLKRAFDTVFSRVPQDAKEVAQVISIVYDKLGELNYAIPETSKKFLDLARMSQEAPKKLAESVSSMLLQWKVPASEAAKTLDLLYTAYTKTHVPITTLTNDVNKQGQVMRQAYGFTLPETIALFASLNEVGISTSDIMRGMDYGWANLMKTMTGGGAVTKQMAPIISTVNAELKKMGGDAKDSGDVMAALFQGIKDGLITSGQAAVVFGNRFSAQMFSAIRDGRLDFKDFLAMLNEAPVSLDKAADATKYFYQKLTELKHGFEVALAPLGIAILGVLTGFMPVIQQIIGGITRLVSAFTSLPQPIQNIIIIIAGLAAILGPLLIIIGLLISSFGAVVTGILSFGSAILSLVVGVASFVASIVMLPLTLVAAVPALLAMVAGFVVLLPLLLLLSPLIIALGIAVGAIVAVLAAAAIALTALAAGFALALALATTFSSTFRGLLGTLAGDLVAFGGHVATAFGFFTKGEWKKGLAELKKGFDDLLNDLKKIDWHSVGEQIIKEIQKGVQDLMNTWGPIWDEIKTSFTNWVDSVDWQKLSEDIPEAIILGLKDLQSQLTPVWNAIVISFNNWKNSVNWTQLASDIPEKIRAGIKWTQDTFGPVWDFIKTSLINWLNSVKWDDVGQKIGSAIRESIKTALNTLVGGLGELIPSGGTAKSPGLFQTGLNAAKNFLGGFRNGLGDLWKLIMDGLEPLAGKIADYMQNKVNWKGIGDSIGTILGSMVTTLLNTLFGSGSPIDKALAGGGDEGGIKPGTGTGQWAALSTGASPFGTQQTGWSKLEQAGKDAGDALVKGFVKGASDAMANLDWGLIIKNAIMGTLGAVLGPLAPKGTSTGKGSFDIGSATDKLWGAIGGNEFDKSPLLSPLGTKWWTDPGLGGRIGGGLGGLGNELGGKEFDEMMSGSWLPKMPALPSLDNIGKSLFGWLPMKNGVLDLGLPDIGWPGGLNPANIFGIKANAAPFGQPLGAGEGGFALPAMPDFGAIFAPLTNLKLPALPDLNSIFAPLAALKMPAMPDLNSILSPLAALKLPAMPDLNSILSPLAALKLPAMPDLTSILSPLANLKLPAMPDLTAILSPLANLKLPAMPDLTAILSPLANLKLPAMPDFGALLAPLTSLKLPALPDFGTLLAPLTNFKIPALSDIQLPNWTTLIPTLPNWLTQIPTLPNWLTQIPTLPNWLTQIPSLPNWLGEIPSLPNWLGEIPSLPNWLGEIPALPSWSGLFPPMPNWGGLFPAMPNWSGLIPAMPNWSNIIPKIGAKGLSTPVDPAKYNTPGTTSATATSAHAEGLRSFATGAYEEPGRSWITNKAQLAVIGEAGPEAVIPQKYWWAIQPWVLQALPKLGGGATIGAGSTLSSANAIEINITGNTISDERAARKLAKTIADTIKHERGII